MHTIWPIAPEFLKEDLHQDYEHFVNVNGHDINLMRYFFGYPNKVGHGFTSGLRCLPLQNLLHRPETDKAQVWSPTDST